MKRGNHSKSRASKGLVLILALVLVFGAAVGGTVAWLMAKTTTITNTFSSSDITVTLSESENLNLQMVPGRTITKDPKVTVAANSENCWLLVKVEKKNDFDTFMTYDMAKDGEGNDIWKIVPGQTDVFYREVTKNSSAQEFAVINGNTVTVRNTVTKTAMNALTEETYPKLEITAYAVQQDAATTAGAAWTLAQDDTQY